jgi:tetratricopeptide (TPR) repeat protein
LPGDETDITRLEEFYSSEPDSLMVVAALGQWYLRNRQRDDALSILQGIQDKQETTQSPFYLASMIAVLIDLGKLAEARSHLSLWPNQDRGHLYWATAGRVFDVADRNDAAAVDAYDHAISLWPGPVEWPMMHRKAQCLSRLGRKEEADSMRMESKRIELLMEAEVHQRLRQAMADLESPETVHQMVEFYEAIHRPREVNCWRDVLERLRAGKGQGMIPQGK